MIIHWYIIYPCIVTQKEVSVHTRENSDSLNRVRETIELLTKAPFEIYFVRKNSELIESKDKTIDGYETAMTEGVAIRILENHRVGFGFSTRLDTEGIEKMIRQALATLQITTEDPAYELLDPSVPYPTLTLRDPALDALQADEKKELVIGIEQAARSFDPRIKQIRNAQISFHEVTVRLITSLGLDRAYTASGVSANIMLTAEDKNSSEYGWESVSSHFLGKINFPDIGKQAARKALDRLGGHPVPGGKYPAILDQEVTAEIIGLLAPSFLGENIFKGKSTLKGKEGQNIFSPCLSLHDGLLFEEGMAAAPFDGEGEPARKTLLIDHGVVSGFLYDHFYGRKLDRPSTANCVRSGLSTPPGCGTTNLFVAPGSTPFQEMVGNLSKGFLVQELMGVHTANPITGDFSLGASGQWIEKGQRIHPVRGVAVSGNLFDMLNHIEAVSQELRWFGTIGAPYLLIDPLTVAGTE